MTSAHRRAYIDWARAVAVLLMIEAHTVDAWTRPADRTGIAFSDLAILGGFAAPLFLWLAGLGVALSAARVAERTGSRARAVETACRRGVEIFILAFLFRLQAFVLSPGGSPVKLFRVDILNVMGPAMVIAGLLWGVATRPSSRAILYGAVAAAIAMATPIVRAAQAVDRLPIWIQWYVRPAGEYTTFTLLPWAGFVFAGAAAGAIIAAIRRDAAERRLHIALAAAGVILVGVGFWAAERPSLYRAASFWTSSPTWFAIRVGLLMVGLAAIYVLERLTHHRSQTCLARIGRSSLFIYWIHVELVYGYASWLWRGRLPLWGTGLAYIAFCAAMFGAVVLRDRVVEALQLRTPSDRSLWRPAPGR